MKRMLFVLMLLMLVLCADMALCQDKIEEQLHTVAEGLDLDPIQRLLGEVTVIQLPNLKQTVLALARGEAVWDTGQILQTLKNALLGTLSGSLWRFARLCAPALLCGILVMLQGSRGIGGTADTAHIACSLAMVSFMVADLLEYIAIAEDTVTSVSRVMEVFFPVLIALLTAVGGTASAALMTPAVSAASGMMTVFMQSVTMHLATATAVTTLLSHLSPRVHLRRLSKLFHGLANWTLGISFTVFIGVTAIQGLGAAGVDGVTLRTAKYAVDNFIPVVGGMVADTMDTLVGCSLLIKNALGAVGWIVILYIVGAPILRTLAAVLIYRLCAALLEPVAETRMTVCLDDFSKVLMLLMTIQLSVGVMFILLIAQVLLAGNLTAMLR